MNMMHNTNGRKDFAPAPPPGPPPPPALGGPLDGKKTPQPMMPPPPGMMRSVSGRYGFDRVAPPPPPPAVPSPYDDVSLLSREDLEAQVRELRAQVAARNNNSSM